MFIVEMIIFMVFLVLLVISPSYYLAGRLSCSASGVALGCDYPTAHLIISESIPSSSRGTAGAGRVRLPGGGRADRHRRRLSRARRTFPTVGAWRWMYATAIIPALLVTLGRFTITESATLAAGARAGEQDARTQMMRLLAREPAYPKRGRIQRATQRSPQCRGRTCWRCSDTANLRATILASVPWFLQDLGTYGIGIFTPTILAASIGHKTKHVAQRRRHDQQ